MKHIHIKLNKDNLAEFEELMPYYTGDEPDKDVIAIGVKEGNTPCAVIVLRKDSMRKVMKIEHLFITEKYRRMGIGKNLISAAKNTAQSGGFRRLELKYAYGDTNVPVGFLVSAGLKNISIAAVTYEFSRSMLGSFLKNDIDAARMKDDFIKENEEKDIRSLSEMPDGVKKRFAELHPVDELSSVAVDGEKVEAYIIISRFDDMYFMSGIQSEKTVGMLSALLFRSVGLVYMNMRDDEKLVFTGYKQTYRNLLSYLFDPVVDHGIQKTIIMLAETGLEKES